MKKPNNIFWMRNISFERIVGTLQILQAKGPLKVFALDAEGWKTGVFAGTKGKAFAKSTNCRYRNIMQKLGLITFEHRQYSLAKTALLQELLTVAAPWPQPLNVKSEAVLAEIVTANTACWEAFFKLLAPANATSLQELRTKGNALILSVVLPDKKTKEAETTKALLPKVLLKPTGKPEVTLTTSTSIAAMVGGLRLWASKLGITDEIRLDSREGLVIAPIRQDLTPEQTEQQLWQTLLEQTVWEDGREWGMCYVPELVRAMLVSAHISAAASQHAYQQLMGKAQKYLIAIPTTSAFIVIKTQYWKQEPAFAKAYFKNRQGVYVSHLRVSSKALALSFEELKNSG